MEVLEFDRHVSAQSSWLRPYALRLTRDPERASDLVQESLLKALLNKDKFRPGTDLKAWMRTVAKHTFINQYRHCKRSRVLEGDMEEHQRSASRATAVDDPLSTYRMNELCERVEALPPGLREAIVLHSQGFKYEEIASRMDVPIGTVKSRIHHARQQLRSTGETRQASR